MLLDYLLPSTPISRPLKKAVNTHRWVIQAYIRGVNKHRWVKYGYRMDVKGVQEPSNDHIEPLRSPAMSLGARLKKIRNERKLTAKELSALSGVPEKTIYRIETGEVTDPKLSSIKPLLQALNCSANEVIFDEDEVFGQGELRTAFLQADSLSIEDQRVIAEMVRRYSLVGYIETNFPREFMTQIAEINKKDE